MNGAPATLKRRSPVFRVVGALLAFVACLYVLMGAAIWYAQTTILYHPRKTLDVTPADLGLKFEPTRLPLNGDRLADGIEETRSNLVIASDEEHTSIRKCDDLPQPAGLEQLRAEYPCVRSAVVKGSLVNSSSCFVRTASEQNAIIGQQDSGGVGRCIRHGCREGPRSCGWIAQLGRPLEAGVSADRKQAASASTTVA